MRLTTIWTMPAMTLRERVHRTRDWATQQVAARLPARVRYWAFIQVGGAAVEPHEIVTDARFVDLLARVPGADS